MCIRHFLTLVTRILMSSGFEKNSKLLTLDLPCKPSQLDISLFLLCLFSLSDCIVQPAVCPVCMNPHIYHVYY